MCYAYQNMTFPTLVCQRIGQNFAKKMKCVENFALSYTFPTCMKSMFSSSVKCGII